jgi:salicylate hydroxylase
VGTGSPHVLIAGAGIGGLTVALALLRQGYDVDVYEQARELKEVGAGLNLSANGNRVLHALRVLDPLKPLACELTGKEIRLWNTGQTWKVLDLGPESVERYGFPLLAAYRPDLLGVLADAVRREKADAIHLNSKCVGFGQDDAGVTLELQDGVMARGHALIGADGVHSTIRRALFGEDRPTYTGIVAWRATIPMRRLPRHMARMVGTNWIGRGAHVVHYPVRRGEMMNFIGSVERDDWKVESWSTRGTADECARDYKGWHGDVHRMIRSAPSLFKWALLGRAPMPRWTVGRVALLGDACHPTLPTLGQGAVMAIEDGFVLAQCLALSDGDVAMALGYYEEVRYDRTRRVMVGSAENARRFHDRALATADSAQAYVESEWSEEKVRQRYEWLYSYDASRTIQWTLDRETRAAAPAPSLRSAPRAARPSTAPSAGIPRGSARRKSRAKRRDLGR